MANLHCRTGRLGRSASPRMSKPLTAALSAALLVALCGGMLAPCGAWAAVRHWDNQTGSNLWFEPANWHPDGAPSPGDHLIVLFGQPLSTQPITTDNDGSITIDGPDTRLSFGAMVPQQITVGQTSRGTLNIQGGSEVAAGSVTVGASADSRGDVFVTGSDSRLTAILTIGLAGAGSLYVEEGAGADGALIVAAEPGSEGIVAFDGPGTSGAFSAVTVGDQGYGQLTLSRSAALSVTNDLVIGRENTDRNMLTVQSGNLTVGGALIVALAGNGTLSLSGGGTVTSGSGVLSGGNPTGGEAVAVVNGPGSLWKVHERLYVGGDASGLHGPGQLFVIRGGSVEVGDLLKIWPTGEVTLNGGSIRAGSIDVRGRLEGAGTITGNVTVGPGSVLSPGMALAGPGGPGGPGGPNSLLLPGAPADSTGPDLPSGSEGLLDFGAPALGALSADDGPLLAGLAPPAGAAFSADERLFSAPPAAVPEPGTLTGLLTVFSAAALVALARARRRRSPALWLARCGRRY